jgi:hypothetical protein
MDIGDTVRMPRITHPPPTVASAGSGVTCGVRVGADAFVTERAVERWVRAGAATRRGALLTTTDGRRYVLAEGLRIIGRRSGENDPFGLTGRVDTLRGFLRRGAVLSASALRLARAVYDVEHGFLTTLQEVSAPSGPGVRLRRARATLPP